MEKKKYTEIQNIQKSLQFFKKWYLMWFIHTH